MFESGGATTADLDGLLAALARFSAATDDAERVTQLDVLERLKPGLCGRPGQGDRRAGRIASAGLRGMASASTRCGRR